MALIYSREQLNSLRPQSVHRLLASPSSCAPAKLTRQAKNGAPALAVLINTTAKGLCMGDTRTVTLFNKGKHEKNTPSLITPWYAKSYLK